MSHTSLLWLLSSTSLLVLYYFLSSKEALTFAEAKHSRSVSLSLYEEEDVVMRDEGGSTPRDTSAVHALKGTAMVIFLTEAIIIHTVVLCSRKRLHTNPRVMHVVGAGSMGIFVAISVAHLLPETAAFMSEYYDEHTYEKFRPPYMMAIAGFMFMILFVRTFQFGHAHAHEVMKQESDEEDEEESDAVAAVAGEEQAPRDSLAAATAEDSTGPQPQIIVQQEEEKPDSGNTLAYKGKNRPDAKASATEIHTSSSEAVALSPSVSDHSPESTAYANIEEEERGGEGAASTAENIETKEATLSKEDLQKRKAELMKLIVLVAMMCAHAMIEGAALGFARTKADVTFLLIAIASHKWSDDLVVSITVNRSRSLSPQKTVAILIVHSFGAPLGVGLGWLLESFLPEIVTAYMLAFSAGTFMYVAFTEIAPEDFPDGGFNLPQLISSLIGAGGMYGIMVLFHDL